jgi:hypothetical protein
MNARASAIWLCAVTAVTLCLALMAVGAPPGKASPARAVGYPVDVALA